MFIPKMSIESFTRKEKTCWVMLNIPLLKTSTGQRSFYYRGVKLWNDLSDKIKLCKNVDTFKRAMRSKLLNEFLKN